MKHIIKLIVVFCLSFTACKETSQTDSKDLRMIDVAGGVGKSRQVYLSEIADTIEYIPLETTPESLLSPPQFDRIFYENDIVYFPQKTDIIKIFNSKGEYISTFNRLGRGPQEYETIGKPQIDNASGKIIINSYDKIVEYSLNGEFIRNISFPVQNEIDKIYFRSYCLKLGDFYFYPCEISYNPTYSVIITDSSSNVIMKLKYPQEEVDFVKIQNRLFSFQDPYIYLHKERLRLINGNNKYVLSIDKDLSIDTAFIINYGKYNAANDASGMKCLPDSRYLWRKSFVFESDNYLFMHFHVGALSNKPYKMLNPSGKEWINNVSCAFFDKRTGEFTFLDQPEKYRLGFIEDMEGGPSIWPKYVSVDNYLISFIPAEEFIAYAESHKVSEKFKTIAAGLKETDNYVFVRVKLK